MIGGPTPIRWARTLKFGAYSQHKKEAIPGKLNAAGLCIPTKLDSLEGQM